MLKKHFTAQLPNVTPHYLQSVLREKRIPLWQLRLALANSISEAKLSRILNGIDPMPKSLESKLTQLIDLKEDTSL